MQSFCDSICRSTLFLQSSQETAEFLYEFHLELWWKEYTLFAFRYIHNSTILYWLFFLIQHVTSYNRITHSFQMHVHPEQDARIWYECVTLLQLVTCWILTHVQYNSWFFIVLHWEPNFYHYPEYTHSSLPASQITMKLIKSSKQ
jgi:hypothetical protein